MWKYGKIVYGKPESRRKACRGRQETKVGTQTETGRERERRERGRTVARQSHSGKPKQKLSFN